MADRQSEAVEAVDVVHGGRWPKETMVSLLAFAVLWHFASMVLHATVFDSFTRRHWWPGECPGVEINSTLPSPNTS